MLSNSDSCLSLGNKSMWLWLEKSSWFGLKKTQRNMGLKRRSPGLWSWFVALRKRAETRESNSGLLDDGPSLWP